MTEKKRFNLLRVAYDSTLDQIRKIGSILLICNIIPLLIFIAIWIVGSHYNLDFGLLTRDPAQLFNFNPLIGIISDLGILLWCSTASICFFVFAHLKSRQDRIFSGLFIASAILTFYLLLDDLFLIHEILGPQYLHIKQNYFYGIYFFIFLGYLVIFFRLILKTEFIMMAMAYLYFGISIVLDYIASKFGIEINTLIEDAFKFFGILLWFLYFSRLGLKVLRGFSPVQESE